MADLMNDLQRLRDMIGGIYALIEEDEPRESSVGAARRVTGEAHYLAMKLCDRENEATIAEIKRAAKGAR